MQHTSFKQLQKRSSHRSRVRQRDHGQQEGHSAADGCLGLCRNHCPVRPCYAAISTAHDFKHIAAR